MRFIVGVCAVPDGFAWIEVPVSSYRRPATVQQDVRGWRNRGDFVVGSEVRRGQGSKATGEIFLAQGERIFWQPNERIEHRTPRDFSLGEAIIEVPRSEKILRQDQSAACRLPNRERPIPDERVQARQSPLAIAGGNDLDIGRVVVKVAARDAKQVRSVVEPTIPNEDRSGRQDIRLYFAPRFGSGVKRTVDHSDGRSEVASEAIVRVRGKKSLGLAEFFNVDRLPVEMPHAVLHAHKDSREHLAAI